MKLTVLNSNSAGNCYILSNGKETLIIELGVNFKRVTEALNHDLSSVVGAVVSHCHGDHFSEVPKALRYGIPVVMSLGTGNKGGYSHNEKPTDGALFIKKEKPVKLGNFDILSFDLNHNCAEPIGFLIRHPDMGTMAFITDTFYVSQSFSGLNHILVECNYSEEILLANKIEDFRNDSTIMAHMSLKTCMNFLENQDLSRVRNIMLIHLSDRNSNAAQFQAKITAQTGKKVTIAEPGVVLDLSNDPF